MTVEAAYAEVERLTRREARNFAYGIRVLPRDQRRAISAIYAFARPWTTSPTASSRSSEKRERLQALRAALDAAPRRRDVRRARRRPRALRHPGGALQDLVDGGLQDTEQERYADFAELDGYCRARRRRGRRRVRRGLRLRRRRAGGDARRGAAADQHHARRARGLGARPRLPAAGRADRVRRHRGRHRRRAARGRSGGR